MNISISNVKDFINEQPGLYAFLRSKRIYSKFIYNCIHHNTDWWNIYRNFKMFSPISSFEWAASPEGSDYWSNIHTEFCIFRSEL